MFLELPPLPPAQQPSYASALQNSRDPEASLQLSFDPVDEDAIRTSLEEVLNVSRSWGYALVGYFPSRHPGKEGLDHIMKAWKTDV